MEKENALTMKLFKPDPIVFERLTTCSLCNISFQNKRWVYINVLFSIFFMFPPLQLNLAVKDLISIYWKNDFPFLYDIIKINVLV